MRGWLSFDAVAHWATGPSHLLRELTPEAKAAHHGKILAGEETLCFALSEADAGPDLWRMQSRAEPPADGGRVPDGEKQWITNGPSAALAIAFAVTARDRPAARTGGIPP